jgi:DNA-binding GntR family transcriptional regulator
MKLVNSQSIVPLYHQMSQILREQISLMKPGDLLPSESDLVNLHKVSRQVIRRAISQLVLEGLVYSIKGKGTIVSHPKIEKPMDMLGSYTNCLRNNGFEPDIRVISNCIEKAPLKAVTYLGIKEDEPVVCITRVSHINDIPATILKGYFPCNRFFDLSEMDMTGKSLYEILTTKYNVKFTRTKNYIDAICANEEQAALLNVKEGMMLLNVDSITYGEGEEPIEFSQTVYRGDHFRLMVDFKVN